MKTTIEKPRWVKGSSYLEVWWRKEIEPVLQMLENAKEVRKLDASLWATEGQANWYDSGNVKEKAYIIDIKSAEKETKEQVLRSFLHVDQEEFLTSSTLFKEYQERVREVLDE